MISFLWLGLVPLAFLLNILLPLARNIYIARATGMPYVIVPYYAYNRVRSIILRYTLLRLANKLLPEASDTSWRRLVVTNWPWKLRHAPFAALGSDSFLTVAPGGIVMHTADADAIAQITARGNDFPKATQLYRHVDIYGTNVVSSGGAIWRRHRAVTAPAFTERNHMLVWKETLDITQTMLQAWIGSEDGAGEPGGGAISQIANDAMRLSLEVIGRAGLGQKMEWPRAAEREKEKAAGKLPPGHTMSFTASLQFLLTHIFYVIAVPRWFLKHSPFKIFKKCYEAYTEWGKYMAEILAARKVAIQSSSKDTGDSPTIDLTSQLLKAQTEGETTTEKSDDQSSKQAPALTDSEVLGNLFMFIIAGHETSANSIHFCLLLLALHPAAQRKVQSALLEIFQSRIGEPATWDYETDFPRLLNSYLAAVLNEELRLVTPTITIPKIVPSPGMWQKLRIDIGAAGSSTGRVVQVPPGCMVRLCLPAVHRNPRFWPHGPATGESDFTISDCGTDLEEFQPERWIVSAASDDDSAAEVNAKSENETEKDIGVPPFPAVTPTKGLYTPPRGAFIPFSDGQRACLGRRFAQVEILAALAAILSSHSVELDVGEFLKPGEDKTLVGGMSPYQKKALWCRARDAAREKLRTRMLTIITLQLRSTSVPLRIVPRGKEWFEDGVVGEEAG